MDDNLIFVDKVVTKYLNKEQHMKKVNEICSRLKAFICDHQVDRGIWTTIIFKIPD